MQQPALDCQRDEYPPVGFWQDQDLHDQYVRMVKGSENQAAGAALFGLGFCHYNNQGLPPSSTQRVGQIGTVYEQNRRRLVTTIDVTTTLSTVSIRFDNFPHQPDFGLTANPCWPSTLIDDPGFALLNSDPWYAGAGNAQRHQYALASYGIPPPNALTQNNHPRAGYDKRAVNPLQGLEVPHESEAEATAADTKVILTSASAPPTIGAGMQFALDAIPKPTGKFY